MDLKVPVVASTIDYPEARRVGFIANVTLGGGDEAADMAILAQAYEAAADIRPQHPHPSN
ncbi:MAG: hypothetical protein IPG34_16730 [Rhodocyclaceae bacterium]|nr:hypothetical protein [Rhodocyclaceae bacterium]